MKNKELEEIFGISAAEARLYLAGLEYGDAGLTELARSAGIPRTAAYYPLEKLVREGFFSVLTVGKRPRYRATAPDELERLLDTRRTRLKEVLADISPSLKNRSGSFSVRYFPGPRGIEQASRIFLDHSKAKLWYTFEHPLHSVKRSGERVFDSYIKERVKLNIACKTIIPATARESEWISKHLQDDPKELRETLTVSAREYPIEASLATDGLQTLLFDATHEPFATLITSAPIAESFISLHRIAWDRYRN